MQEMYVAYYGRPADPPGLKYWSQRLEGENGLATVLDAFGNSQEFTDSYGDLPPTELVNGLYNQMFGRDAEEGGLAFYTSRLENGAASLAVIAKQIADGAQGQDAIVLARRVEVANSFTQSIYLYGPNDDMFALEIYGPNDISDAQRLMSLVTSDYQSVMVAYEASEAWKAEHWPLGRTIRPYASELAGPDSITCGETAGQDSDEIHGLSSYDEVKACMVNALAARQPFVAYLLVDGSTDLVYEAVAYNGMFLNQLWRDCPLSDPFCQGIFVISFCSGSGDDPFMACNRSDI